MFIKADANCELHEWGDFTIPNPTKHLQLVHNYDVTRDILDVTLLTVQVRSMYIEHSVDKCIHIYRPLIYMLITSSITYH